MRDSFCCVFGRRCALGRAYKVMPEVAQVTGETVAATIRHVFLPAEETILGISSAMNEVREKLEKVACTDVPVLIRGEAGSGKEILARLIHNRYPGAGSYFHKVIPAGHNGWRKSASYLLLRDKETDIPGAAQRAESRGKPFCIGTLFFDEVGELNPAAQRNLLRLLQEDRPSVSAKNAPPLFRVICSTKHDLDQEMRRGNFREDLYYSINVVCLVLPPLRTRLHDLPVLAKYLWQRSRDEYCSVTPEPSSRLITALQEYDWPGNIRELSNLMERYVLLDSEDKIIEELSAEKHAPLVCKASPAGGVSLKTLAKHEAREVERKMIFKTLRETQWNRRQAARALNISYRALLYKIKEAGVPPKRSGVKREIQN